MQVVHEERHIGHAGAVLLALCWCLCVLGVLWVSLHQPSNLVTIGMKFYMNPCSSLLSPRRARTWPAAT